MTLGERETGSGRGDRRAHDDPRSLDVCWPQKQCSDDENDPLDRPVQQLEWHSAGDSTKGTEAGPTTTKFSYLGISNGVTSEVAQMPASGTKTRTYAFDGLGQRVTITEQIGAGPVNRYSYLYDTHGSVSLLLDQTNAVKASYGYTAYGAANTALTKTNGFQASSNPYRYTGKRFDTGSNTLDMGARRYSAGTGRFLQYDQYYGGLANLGLSTDPLLANRYLFTGANPINYIEIDGHRFEDSGGSAGMSACEAAPTMDGCFAVPHGNPDDASEANLRAYGQMQSYCAPPGLFGGGAYDAQMCALWREEWELSFDLANDMSDCDGWCVAGELAMFTPVGKAAKVGKVGIKAGVRAARGAGAFGKLEHASKLGIQSYKVLRGAIRGRGLQAHHLIEKRFAETLGFENGADFLSIVVTKKEHQIFTNAWRKAIGYRGSKNPINTVNATQDDIIDAAREIYKDYPAILAALGLK